MPPTRTSTTCSRAPGSANWVAGLPEGLETPVGQDGALLSGGQRQRVTLARGLLAPGGLLVLDEPTSHLDAASEAAFLDDAHRAFGHGPQRACAS